jgi:hypothetical protein
VKALTQLLLLVPALALEMRLPIPSSASATPINQGWGAAGSALAAVPGKLAGKLSDAAAEAVVIAVVIMSGQA